MSRRARLVVVATVAALLATAPAATLAPLAVADQPPGYGPSDPFDDALMGDTGTPEPMKNLSKIVRTDYGYRLTSGQQNNRLKIRLTTTGQLRFRDPATPRWKSMPRACKPRPVSQGIAAVCRVPASTSHANPTLLEIHPRLGNDVIDGRTLPAVFELAVLADAGRDIVYTGAGNDFINGAQDGDRAYGGAGNDWIRGGTGDDLLFGGDGNDYMVGGDGRDSVDGGSGTNRIYDN